MPAKMYLDPTVYVPMPENESFEKKWAEDKLLERIIIPVKEPLVFETRVDESGIEYSLIRRLTDYDSVS